MSSPRCALSPFLRCCGDGKKSMHGLIVASGMAGREAAVIWLLGAGSEDALGVSYGCTLSMVAVMELCMVKPLLALAKVQLTSLVSMVWSFLKGRTERLLRGGNCAGAEVSCGASRTLQGALANTLLHHVSEGESLKGVLGERA